MQGKLGQKESLSNHSGKEPGLGGKPFKGLGVVNHCRDQFRRARRPVQALLLTVPSLLGVLNLMWYEKILRGVFKAFFLKGDKKVWPPILSC